MTRTARDACAVVVVVEHADDAPPPCTRVQVALWSLATRVATASLVSCSVSLACENRHGAFRSELAGSRNEL
jgi:hypothetical protein